MSNHHKSRDTSETMNAFKKLMKKFGSLKTNRLMITGLAITFVIFLLLAPNFAYADSCWFDVACWTNYAVSWISYFIALVAGIFIAIEAWMIGILLTIGSHIVDSPAVEAGFPITLSLANLGFVLGIIIIAIATILRYEQYGMKKILMKLVAAAILVNFSLVITGVIINFSNQLTGFFLNSLGGPKEFASNIAGAFQPQREFTFVNESSTAAISPDDLKKIQGGFASPAGSGVSGSIGEVLAPLASLVFIVATLIVMVITLFALIIMLVIRYIFLGILLVLMPLVWVAWVFPLTQSHWQKWWNQFLRWTFFSPIVVFFLWVAIMAASKVNSGAGVFKFDTTGPGSNNPFTAVAEILTNIFTPLVVNMMQASIVVGLMIGGLYAANSMGITFASTAMGTVKGIGKGAGSWAGRRSKQLGGATLDRLEARKLSEKLQQTQLGGLSQVGSGRGRLGRILTSPVRGIGKGLQYGLGWGGRGIETLSVATRENLVKDAKKRLGDKTSGQLQNNMTTYTAPERIAAAQMLFERGDIENLDDARHVSGADWGRFNQESAYKKFNRQGRLADDDVLAALPDAMTGNVNRLDEAVRNFVATLNKSDIAQNRQLNGIFGGDKFMGRNARQMDVLSQALIKEMALTNPSLISAIIPKLKGAALENFGRMFALARQSIAPDQRQKTEERFEKMIQNNIIYAGTGEPFRGETPTPPPATPTP